MSSQISILSDGLIRLPQVLQLIPVSRATWYNGIKSGHYPAPVKLGPRVSAWRLKEIRALIEKANNEV